MLARTAAQKMSDWLHSPRRKPLVLRGARQVGKSTLVRQFAAQQNRVLNEVNLERHLYLDKAFATLNPKTILAELEVVSGRQIDAKRSLLFLDEVQATPHALHALRYFFEDYPNLPVVAAGSLLEFTLADHSFPMPVGRIQYMYLGPLTFKEFLQGRQPELVDYLARIEVERKVPDSAHRELSSRQREYLLVGGMPEAVDACCEGSFQEVAHVHRSIAETYLDDFSKYARQKDLLLLQRIFRFVPRNLGRKTKYVHISRDDRAATVRSAIDLLVKARICYPVHHSACSGLPLLSDIKLNTYKLLFLDIGLANHVCGMDWLSLNAMTEGQLVNEGGLAEQFIGQHLIEQTQYVGPPLLTYWLREGKGSNAEVDYVVSRGNWIVPIEVKSGKSGSLRSLHQFVLHKAPSLAVRFDANPPRLQRVSHLAKLGNNTCRVDYPLLSLPLYAVEELPRLVDHLRAKGPGI
ncbi:MAG: ATP-binding protein [Proteobacteria bacterium]|nr:ATP-binding protein [Pseudomonadota bacterium]